MREPSMRKRAGLLRDHWYVAARSGDVEARRPVARTILG